MTRGKQCTECREKDRIKGELYCGSCKPKVLRRLRGSAQVRIIPSVRTLSASRTEDVGRAPLPEDISEALAEYWGE